MAFRLKDHAGGDDWGNIIVVLNASKHQQQVAIPDGQYTVVTANGTVDAEGIGTVSGSTLAVGPQQAVIIHD